MVGEMFRLLTDSAVDTVGGSQQKRISSFQAFAVSVATRVGTGNLAGVASAIAILLFAFSSIIGNYYYGEVNIRFITPNTKVLTAYRICSAGVMVIFGALASFELVWNIVDFFMAFLTACNLTAIVLLGRYAFRLLDDYRCQKRQGIKEPTFHRSQFPELESDLECWE